MKKYSLLAAIIFSVLITTQAVQLTGALRINTDATGTNTKSSAITITAQTNLLAGSVVISNLTANTLIGADSGKLLTSVNLTTAILPVGNGGTGLTNAANYGDVMVSNGGILTLINGSNAMRDVDEFFYGDGTSDPSPIWKKSGTFGVSSAFGATNRFGVARTRSATSTANIAGLAKSQSEITLGGGPAYFEWITKVTPLSAAGRTYWWMAGLMDNYTTTNQADAVCFLYSHGLNSGKFYAYTISNTGTPTLTDTGTTVANDTWYRLGILFESSSSVKFSINGSVVATNTTTIPTGAGRELGRMNNIFPQDSNAGDLDVYFDYCAMFAPTVR